MPSLLRSLVFASLIGLVALPGMAVVSVAADRSRASDAPQSANSPAGTDWEHASSTDLDKSYSRDKSDVQQSAVVSLPDRLTDPVWTVAQIALAVLMMVMIVVGLTITLTLLRKDMKQRRRSFYRVRGRPRPGF